MDNMPSSPAGRNRLCLNPNITQVVPTELRELQRWTGWNLLPPRKAGAKPGKKPLSLTNDARTWKSFGEALGLAASGVGFQMLGVTSYVGIDLDNCVTESGTSQFAAALLNALPDTYAEITPSGKGLRIFARRPEGMEVPEFLANAHGVECYVGKSARFLTVTGNVLPGREGKLADLTLPALRMLAPLAATVGGGVSLEVKLPVPQVERIADWTALLDDRLEFSKLRKEWKTYLTEGDMPGGRSERTFAIACALLTARYSADEVFAFLVSAPGSWEAALDKRDQDPTRARALVWSDVGRAQKIVRADDAASAADIDTWQALGLKTTYSGKKLVVARSPMNALRILTTHDDWTRRIALDVTTGEILFDNTRLDDSRFFEVQEKVSQFAKWEPNANRQWWVDILRAAAEQNPVNPREAELRALTWDGVPRLDRWLVERVTPADSPLDRVLGRKFLIGLVARWVDPGCKNDTVFILQGKEGARKNTLFEALAGGKERVIPIDGMEREDKLVVARAWIAEMPEASLLRRADKNRLKGFTAQAIDHYRPPYAANPVAVKRGFALVSTANAGALFNSDQDGLRRFWPVQVKDRIDYEWVVENREQLLAEALLAYDLGEEWWFDAPPEGLTERVQGALEVTAVDEAIEELIERQRGKGGMRFRDVLLEIGAMLGHNPPEKTVQNLLWKHGVRQRRTAVARMWLHVSWARPGVAGEADVLPLRPVAARDFPDDAEEMLG